MSNLDIVRTTQDQDLLWSFHDDPDYNVRFTVARRTDDKDRLWEMRNDEDVSVRYEVAERIEDEGMLMEMLLNEDEPSVRIIIEKRLSQVSEEEAI